MERDTAYDALRCETLGPGTALPPANVRFGPDLQAAWKTLYGFAGTSASPETLKQWQARQAAAREARGAGYFDWVLDQAGLDIVVANRVTMATRLDARHFRWVPYDDALLFPLDNSVQKAQNPDRKILYEAEEQLLKSYLSAVGVSRLPSTLDAYLDQVVVAMLKDQKSHGAVAIKFEVASCDRSSSSRSRVMRLRRSTRGTPRTVCRIQRTTRGFRIFSFARSRRARDRSALCCTSTPEAAAASTLTLEDRIRSCSKRC